jgi:CO/xanthine dehydrogenase Mo-binding subunit
MTSIGVNHLRSDAEIKVRGEARYTTDLNFRDMLFGAIFRSPVAAGKIKSIDTSLAEAADGVIKVITSKDAPSHRHGLVVADQRIFASDEITYAGEPIAAIAANTLAQARAALNLIELNIEPVKPVVDLLDAINPKTRVVHHDWKTFVSPDELYRFNNIVGKMVYEDDAFDEALESADLIIENEFKAGRQYQAYMEPKGVVAIYEDQRFIVHISHQFPFNVRDRLAQALNIKRSVIRVIGHHIGGGFGAKLDLGIEPYACILAKLTKRPVKIIQSRSEDMATCPVRENAIVRLRSGVKGSGEIIATEMDVIMDAGAAAGDTPFLSSIPLFLAGAPYRPGVARVRCRVVYTNTPPTGAFRGVSGTYLNFAIERQMDEIAIAINMDRREFRLKNLIQNDDKFLNGQSLPDASILGEAFSLVETKASWDKFGVKKLRGVGIASVVWLTNPLPGSAFLKLNEDGAINLITAATENGSGAVAMGLRQIAASEFGITPDSIIISMPDTDTAGYDSGSQGSRTTQIVGRAIQEASNELKEKIFAIASQILEAQIEDLELVDGLVGVIGVPSSRLSLATIASHAQTITGPLIASGAYMTPEPMFDKTCASGLLFSTFPTPTYHVHLAEVEVDPLTGNTKILKYIVAQEVGRAINPNAIFGQIRGAVAQGIGYTLFENLDIGLDGQYLQKTLEAYRLPIAADIPKVEIILLEHPDQSGPYGAKGVAEPPIVPVAGAIVNAISNAINWPINSIPVRPINVLDGIRKSEAINATKKKT